MQATEIEALKTVVSDVLLKRGVLSNLKVNAHFFTYTYWMKQYTLSITEIIKIGGFYFWFRHN